jgi:hypothetical protein
MAIFSILAAIYSTAALKYMLGWGPMRRRVHVAAPGSVA